MQDLEMRVQMVQPDLGLTIPDKRRQPLTDIVGSLNRLMETAMTQDDVQAMVDTAVASRPPTRIILETSGQTPREIAGIVPVNFFRVLSRARLRKNVLLVGPAGCGKTTLAHQVADALGMRFGHITLTAGMSEGNLLGRLLPTGEGGRFEYNFSQFVDFYESGGVYLLDEMDASDENTLLAINTALANGRMAVPGRTGQPEAIRHPDFCCIACANTYGNGADRTYVGRNQLDGATLDRFRVGMISCDYDSRIEDAVVYPMVLRWARGMRERIVQGNLRRFVSTRFLRDATEMLEAQECGWDDLLDAYFSDWSQDEKNRVGDLAPQKPFDPSVHFAEMMSRQQNLTVQQKSEAQQKEGK